MKQKLVFILSIIWQFTWGILQNIVGLIAFLIFVRKRHVIYKNSIVTEISGSWGGITLGMFVFVDGLPTEDEKVPEDFTVKHEYGHVLQSILLGPLWVLIIGFPSLIWAGCFDEYRIKHNISYYDFYTEKWANYWGKV